MKKKATKAQLRARKKFAQMAKSGKLAKLRKSASKKSKLKKTSTKPRKKFATKDKKFIKSMSELRRARKDLEKTTREASKFLQELDMPKLMKALSDPKVKEITIKK